MNFQIVKTVWSKQGFYSCCLSGFLYEHSNRNVPIFKVESVLQAYSRLLGVLDMLMRVEKPLHPPLGGSAQDPGSLYHERCHESCLSTKHHSAKLGNAARTNYNIGKGSDALKMWNGPDFPLKTFSCCLMKRLSVEELTAEDHASSSSAIPGCDRMDWSTGNQPVKCTGKMTTGCEGSEGPRAESTHRLPARSSLMAYFPCVQDCFTISLDLDRSFQIPLGLFPGCKPFSRLLLMSIFDSNSEQECIETPLGGLLHSNIPLIQYSSSIPRLCL